MSKNKNSQSFDNKTLKNNNNNTDLNKQNKNSNNIGNIYTYNIENLTYVGNQGEVITTFSLDQSNTNTYSNINFDENRKSSPIRGGIINLGEKNIQNLTEISMKERNNAPSNSNNNQNDGKRVYPVYNVNTISIQAERKTNKSPKLNQVNQLNQKKTTLKSTNKKPNTNISNYRNNYSKINAINFSLSSKKNKKYNYNLKVSKNSISILTSQKNYNNINNNNNNDKSITSTSLFIDNSQAIQGSRVYLSSNKNDQNYIQQSININLNKDDFNQNPVKSEFQKSFDAFLLEPHSTDNKYVFINNSDGNYQSKIVNINSIKDLKEQFQKFLNNLGKNRNKSPYIIPYNEFLKIISNNIENSNDLFFELKSFLEKSKKYQYNSLIKTEKEKSLMILSSIRKNKEYNDFSDNTPMSLLDNKSILYMVTRWIKYSFPSVEYTFSYPSNNEEFKFEKESEINDDESENQKIINKNNKALEEIERVKKDLLNEFSKKDQESKKLKSVNQKLKNRKNTNEKKKKYQEKIKDKNISSQIVEKDYAYKPEVQRKINEWENRPFVSSGSNFSNYNNSFGNQKMNVNNDSFKQQK